MSADPLGPQLLLQVVLIFLNAFFASTEIAVISLNANKLRRQAEDGDKAAARMLRMVEEPSGFLSTIQVGITLGGFLASAFAAESFSDRLVNWLYNDLKFTLLPMQLMDAVAVVLITIILSYFMLVFGELVPKRIAMQKPMLVARATTGVVSGLHTVMRPVVWLLSASTNATLRLLRLKTASEEEEVTEEDIRLMVDIGEDRGAINSEEKEMIENIFQFNNTTAHDVMVHCVDVEAIHVEDSPEEIVSLIQQTGLSRFPVYDEDINDILGILNTREYLLNSRSPHPKPLQEILRPAYFVPESVHTDVLFRDMQKKKLHFAVVIDEYGETAGIVTMEDLLEEIVGNIYDEYDPQEEQDITQVEDNLWRVSGSADIETLFENLSLQVPEDLEVDTLGGLVFSQLRSIPKDGTVLDVDACGLHIHVDQIADRRVEWALVSKLPPETVETEEEE